jgi:hypothetical protein
MALQSTQGVMLPAPTLGAYGPPALASTVIDASAEKVAWIGPVLTPNRGSKNVQTVGFLPGAITSAGGSTMRLSLQNVDTATGNPPRPDGTQDQTVDFLASAPTASTFYTTGNLSATRSVAHGEMLAVVLEFQSFAGADVFNVQNITVGSSIIGSTSVSLFTASWAAVGVAPNVILGFDDGSFGTLGAQAYPAATLTSDSVNTGTTPDEVALAFTVPFSCKVDGAWFSFNPAAATRNFDVILYDGTSALVTVSVDAETVKISQSLFSVHFAEQTLSPGTSYYLAIKPTTASSGTLYGTTVTNANHFQAMAGGTAFSWAQRTDAGAWSPTTTKRPFMGIIISALDDGVGGGGARVIGG